MIDEKIQPLIGLDDNDAGINFVYEHAVKISVTQFCAKKNLKENKSFINTNLNDSQASKSSIFANENAFANLPKSNIQKFYGDCTQFNTIFNTFITAIHQNNSPSEIEKN